MFAVGLVIAGVFVAAGVLLARGLAHVFHLDMHRGNRSGRIEAKTHDRARNSAEWPFADSRAHLVI
jgi:hypothetical protein